ncbi:MAG: tetratricopeptide repeat protein [Candidatus Riflebacteria bacterium]|nr:tetratricopeptide repeat protein [Candidatus Riflebacteria bacterium]
MQSRSMWRLGVLLVGSSLVLPVVGVSPRVMGAAPATVEESQVKAFETAQKSLAAARAFREQGKVEKAVAEYRKSIAADPATIDAYLELGELYSQNNSPRKAVEVLDIGIGMALAQEIGGPDIGRYCVLLARNHEALGRMDLASGDLIKAVKYLPDDPLPFIALGDMQAGRGRFDQAVAAFRQALALDPGNVEGWWAFGNAAIKGRLPEAMREAHRGLAAIDPAQGAAFAELMKTAVPGKEPARP